MFAQTRWAVGLLALYLLFPAAPAASEGQLRVGLFAIGPWAYRNDRDELKGVFAELSATLASETGLDLRSSAKPYKRVIMDMRTGRSDICFVFSGAALDEVAVKIGALHSLAIVLIGRHGEDLDQILSSSAASVAVLGGTSFPTGSIGIRQITVDSPVQQINMLKLGRISAALGVRETLSYHYNKLRQAGDLPFDSLPQRPVTHLSVQLYLSKRSYSPQLAQRLTSALDRLVERGDLARIMSRHVTPCEDKRCN